jgi:hypothetical protein
MRLNGYSKSGLPSPVAGAPKPRPPGPLNRAVQRLRTHARYIAFWNVMRRRLMPALAGLATIYLAYAVLSVGVMSAR